MSTTPISGRPGSVSRLQPAADGVQISKRGLQLVEDRQHQLAARPEQTLQSAPRRGLEQDREIAVACEERGERDAEHGVGGIGPPLDRQSLRSFIANQSPCACIQMPVGRSSFVVVPAASRSQIGVIEEVDLVDDPDPWRRSRVVGHA